MTRSLGRALGGFTEEDSDVEVFSGGLPGDVPEFDGPECDKDGNVLFRVTQYGRTLENLWPKENGKRMTWARFGELMQAEAAKGA